VKDSSSLDYDAYIYKYRFGYPNRCLRLTEADERAMQRNMDYTGGSEVDREGLYTFTTTLRSVPITLTENYFVPYPSRYSGGFTLLDTMKVPRPCAYQSQNLTSVQYYRGQNTLQYDVYGENSATVASYMTGNIEVIYQDGVNANNLAFFNK